LDTSILSVFYDFFKLAPLVSTFIATIIVTITTLLGLVLAGARELGILGSIIFLAILHQWRRADRNMTELLKNQKDKLMEE
jgi:hypothetical protein